MKLYIHRKEQQSRALQLYRICIDSKEVGVLRNGETLCVEFMKGIHTLEINSFLPQEMTFSGALSRLLISVSSSRSNKLQITIPSISKDVEKYFVVQNWSKNGLSSLFYPVVRLFNRKIRPLVLEEFNKNDFDRYRRDKDIQKGIFGATLLPECKATRLLIQKDICMSFFLLLIGIAFLVSHEGEEFASNGLYILLLGTGVLTKLPRLLKKQRLQYVYENFILICIVKIIILSLTVLSQFSLSIFWTGILFAAILFYVMLMFKATQIVKLNSQSLRYRTFR